MFKSKMTIQTTVLCSYSMFTIYTLCSAEENLVYRDFKGLLSRNNSTGSEYYNCTCSCLNKENTDKNIVDQKLLCHCDCNVRQQLKMNSPELKQRLEELKQNLTIPKNQTNKAKRQRISVYERRLFAVGIGSFGIIILTFLLGAMIVCDIPVYIRIIRRFYSVFKNWYGL